MHVEDQRAVTVLVADDHPMLRQGIRLTLNGQANLVVVGEAADGEEALERIDALKPDVLILDLDMPKRDGFAVVRALIERGTSVGIIILTLHTGADLIAEAMDLGVRGYIIKSSAVIEVVEAVRRVAGGGSYLSAEAVAAMQAGAYNNTLPRELLSLTPIERRLVRAIAEGRTSREIAADLELSSRTIENYRSAICKKLDLSGANALLRYVLEKRSSILNAE